MRVAQNEFRRIQIDKQNKLASLAGGSRFLTSLKRDDAAELSTLMERIRTTGGFDYLNLLNQHGTKRLTADGWIPWQMPISSLTEKLHRTALSDERKNGVSGIEIYPHHYWSMQKTISPELVVFPLVETQHAPPTDRMQEDRAMVIRVLQQVVDANNESVALLEGGTLLNSNFNVVDEIRDLVYGEGSLVEGSIGTVTVFLEDVRITTNVPSDDQSRALGTRVSTEVRNRVLREGQTWIDRAFVVNDWYISAYEPIVDVEGNKVGMLYAGYLEGPYRHQLHKGIALISAMLMGGSLLALGAAVYGAQSIFKPVEAIARVIRATALGERRRIGKIDSGDEIGEVAGQFDFMLDTLEQNQSRIENDARHLEEKVRSRTKELQLQNVRLQESMLLVNETRQRLAMAEKLAAVGQLTAGVAHEINNPTAVILGNMDILLEEIGDARSEVQTEIDLIIEQVYRIRSITDRLLQYSRPSGGSAQFESFETQTAVSGTAAGGLDAVSPPDTIVDLDINDAVSDTLHLVQHELDGKAIKLDISFDANALVRVDRQEFQQVLVNLLSNAIDAVDRGGRISLMTGSNDSEVWLIVNDDGKGIAADDLQRLFDPFFTSDKESGTGLGLSVSYGIVRRYDGHIDVQSTPSKGAQFTVRFPISKLVSASVRQATTQATLVQM
ncbi:MAG: cache domain-containing protein [Granulosicoccaceae bacterium]